MHGLPQFICAPPGAVTQRLPYLKVHLARFLEACEHDSVNSRSDVGDLNGFFTENMDPSRSACARSERRRRQKQLGIIAFVGVGTRVLGRTL